MLRGISTHLFLAHRLTPSLLDSLQSAGAQAIEVFAARHHFDYTDRGAVRETANWFRAHDVQATMHMPLFFAETAGEWSRHTAPTLNLIGPAKAERIEAQDEVKRALEAAEQVPFRSCVLHLGLRDDEWDTRSLDDSLTAIEHLKAFAGPLGVRLLLENLNNNVATPEHLVEICRVGHFDSVGFCLDTGHAHIHPAIAETSHAPAKSGLEQAFEAFSAAGADRLAELHVHDNHGLRDEHLWPGEGTMDWQEFRAAMQRLAPDVPAMLEIAHEAGAEPGPAAEKALAAWNTLLDVEK